MSESVNRMSRPVLWACAARSESTLLTRTVKLVVLAGTFVWSIVIALRYNQLALCQADATVRVKLCVALGLAALLAVMVNG